LNFGKECDRKILASATNGSYEAFVADRILPALIALQFPGECSLALASPSSALSSLESQGPRRQPESDHVGMQTRR